MSSEKPERDEFKRELLRMLPNLRGFAVSLVGSQDRADDLVQDTIMKAWGNKSRFEPGTNMKAWLFTILRNEFYSQMRKKGREVQDSEGVHTESLSSHPAQLGNMDLKDFQKALAKLPDDQREAIVLVGASGMSYEEASEVCGCAVGTIKSRVNRARERLKDLLEVSGHHEFGPDATNAAITKQPLTL
ncbi:sigma-70 family RNA polymerase sigma factor [Maritalea porphyrae]|uniref:RNA polymerase sigma factor n=1 Tax=Maritalea porphyrae TaxID=880732 RepID=A0ABQ5UKZ2_9HYPH|nr:sigma-70 family RNA polymerase sigma factor [Maritalea porphyrae]GLQ15945.1 RNA polymerase sigma factor [Maritalea porphyrae]